ncbi:tRNA-dihydrouridine synthase [Escherichia coli]
MGCPAKKVNRRLAGSALLQYPESSNECLPRSSMQWTFLFPEDSHRLGTEHRNCEEIAQLAETVAFRL